MLRRRSARSKSDLHRRKSTSSARSIYLEHIDAVAAQRDATIAAAHAFVRDQDRPSAEMSLFPPAPAPSPRHHESKTPRSRSLSIRRSEDNARKIRRQQSIRFVGPSHAKGTTKSASTIPKANRAYSNEGDSTLLATPSRTGCHSSPRPSVLQSTENLRVRTASRGKDGTVPPVDSLVGAYINSLSAGDEYYTAEDDIASAPSSYRRIRPPQSPLRLSSTADRPVDDRASTRYFNISTPDRRRQPLPLSSTASRLQDLNYNKENNLPLSRSSTSQLRAPKSMSFLTGRNRAASTGSKGSIQSESIPRPAQRFASQPSSFSRSRTTHSDWESTGMRKSLRSSSSNSAVPISAATSSLVVPKGGSLRSKARKVSKSLKSRLRNLFSFSKSEPGAASLPEQHIETQKTHVSTGFGSLTSTSTVTATPLGGEIPAEGSLRRVSSNVASVHTVSPEEMPRSRQASIESQRGGQDPGEEKSRVTSWASSNPTASVTSQQQASSEWEKQRLSVIKENGLHSPSLRGQMIATTPTWFRGESGHGSSSAPILPGPTIDSQRVYSALMKRLKETTQLAQIVEQQRKSSGEHSNPVTTTPGSTSGCSQMDVKEPTTPVTPTLRHVHRSDENFHGDSIKLEVKTPIVRQQAHMAELENPWTEQHPSSSRQRSSSAATAASYTAYPNAAPRDGQGLSPPMELIPRMDGSPLGSRALSDSSSASFSSPSRHLFRAAGAYRRALQENMRATETSAMSKRHGIASFSCSRDGLCEAQAALREPSVAEGSYSESVYSNQTVGDAPASDGFGSMVDAFPEPPNMLADGSVFANVTTFRPSGVRSRSSGSSMDWKTWLAANASKLEPQFSPTRSERLSEVEFVLPRMPKAFGHGHIRERAQICGDEDDLVAPSELPTHQPSLPTSPRSAQAPGHPEHTPAPKSVHRITPPASPLRNQAKSPISVASKGLRTSYGPPPPIPPRSCLRPSPSPALASVKSACHTQGDNAALPPQTPVQSAAERRTRSLARIRSLNRMRGTYNGSPQAPLSACSRLARRNGWTPGCVVVDSAATSPELTAAVQRQFGAATQYVRAASGGKENVRVEDVSEDAYGAQGTGLSGPLHDAQAMGSKRMVDLFLGSRRRRMAGTDDGDAFI